MRALYRKFLVFTFLFTLTLPGLAISDGSNEQSKPYKSICQNVFFIISAPSGTGKTVAMNDLMKKQPNIVKLVSTTDRAMRSGEKDGVDYKFRTKSAYQKLIEKDMFIENLKVYNNNYGILKADLKSLLKNKNDVIVDLNVEGALQVKKSVDPKDARVVLIYLLPPSLREVRMRLNSRGTDSKEIIDGRMKEAVAQLNGFENYDFIIEADDREKVVTNLESIYRAFVLKRETCSADSKVEQLEEEYKEMKK